MQQKWLGLLLLCLLGIHEAVSVQANIRHNVKLRMVEAESMFDFSKLGDWVEPEYAPPKKSLDAEDHEVMIEVWNRQKEKLATGEKLVTPVAIFTLLVVSTAMEVIIFGVKLASRFLLKRAIDAIHKTALDIKTIVDEKYKDFEAFAAETKVLLEAQTAVGEKIVKYAKQKNLLKKYPAFDEVFSALTRLTIEKPGLGLQIEKLLRQCISPAGINMEKFVEELTSLGKSLVNEALDMIQREGIPSSQDPGAVLAGFLSTHPAFAAIYPYITPVFGLLSSAGRLAIALLDLKGKLSDCKRIKNGYELTNYIFLRDVDWTFCRFWGTLLTQLQSKDVALDQLWDSLPKEIKSDHELSGLFAEYAKPLADVKAKVMQKFQKCVHFTKIKRDPKHLPIREIWGENFPSGRTPSSAAGEEYRHIVVHNQPSIVMTKDTALMTTLTIVRPENVTQKPMNRLTWLHGDITYEPITFIMQRSADPKKVYLEPGGVDFDVDMTSRGILKNSRLEPVLFGSRYTRMRDVRWIVEEFCKSFPEKQRTKDQNQRCKEVSRSAPEFVGALTCDRHTHENPNFVVFAPPARWRCLVKPWISDYVERERPPPPYLMMYYARDNFGAPVVEIVDISDAETRPKINFWKGEEDWFRVPVVHDSWTSAECPNVLFKVAFKKDYSLPVPDGFLEHHEPMTPKQHPLPNPSDSPATTGGDHAPSTPSTPVKGALSPHSSPAKS